MTISLFLLAPTSHPLFSPSSVTRILLYFNLPCVDLLPLYMHSPENLPRKCATLLAQNVARLGTGFHFSALRLLVMEKLASLHIATGLERCPCSDHSS